MSSRSKACPRNYAMAEPRLDPVQRIERAETFFAATGADIRHGGNMAYYNMAPTWCRCRPFEAFRDAESYYATLAHECTHNADVRIMPRRCRLPGFSLAKGTSIHSRRSFITVLTN